MPSSLQGVVVGPLQHEGSRRSRSSTSLRQASTNAAYLFGGEACLDRAMLVDNTATLLDEAVDVGREPLSACRGQQRILFSDVLPFGELTTGRTLERWEKLNLETCESKSDAALTTYETLASGLNFPAFSSVETYDVFPFHVASNRGHLNMLGEEAKSAFIVVGGSVRMSTRGSMRSIPLETHSRALSSDAWRPVLNCIRAVVEIPLAVHNYPIRRAGNCGHTVLDFGDIRNGWVGDISEGGGDRVVGRLAVALDLRAQLPHRALVLLPEQLDLLLAVVRDRGCVGLLRGDALLQQLHVLVERLPARSSACPRPSPYWHGKRPPLVWWR
ncbi:unnamed protein product [Sphagnum tenellum]